MIGYALVLVCAALLLGIVWRVGLGGDSAFHGSTMAVLGFILLAQILGWRRN